MLRHAFLFFLAGQLTLTSTQIWAIDHQRSSNDSVSEVLKAEGVLHQNIEQWSGDKEALVPELILAAERLSIHAENIGHIHGEKYLAELLTSNQLVVYDEVLKTELTYRMIDGVRVPRIIFGNEAYLIFDEKVLPKNSKHLEQYIARLFFDARKSGLNVNLVVLNDGRPHVEHMKKPKATEWRWWREYFVSKYKSPTFNDFTLALFNGVALQGALTMVMSWLKYNIQGTEITTAPALWTMAYGVAYGTFISTIRNWTVLSGEKFTRVLKSQTLSMLYAYGLVLAVGQGDFSDRLATVSLFTLQGLGMNISIMANGLMNNFAKDYWNQIPRLRDMTRENAGYYKFDSAIMNKLFGWRKASVEGQLLYMIPWSINVISLMTMATSNWLQIPGTSISLPIFQLAGIPIAMYWSKMYSARLAKKAEERARIDTNLQLWARELRETATSYENSWQKSFGMKVSEIPERLLEFGSYIKSKTVQLGRACVDLLRGPQ